MPSDAISRLPPPARLREVMQALAALDAILCPEWEYRYFSFDSRWGAGETMGSIRNGQGDNLFVLFNAAGAFINGLDHELWEAQDDPLALYRRVPPAFASGVAEPAFSPDHATFCCWRAFDDEAWGYASLPSLGGDDGSYWLLGMLNGDPATYLDFARSYYEVEVDADLVAQVHQRTPITPGLATALNPEIDFEALRADLEEIGYPVAAE